MTDAIKFILNDQIHEIRDISPTTTLLQYLREQARLTGTKEGCAEGDCGACTVIVTDAAGDSKAVNACILFMPVLDGRHVMTVEHLDAKEKLHPVQDAMVKCHGSQCGFCTPGFVMSLAAMTHCKDKVTDENICDAIAGNLCRCTGYRPIIDAARMAATSKDRKIKVDPQLLKPLQRMRMFTFENAQGKFFAPVTVQELGDVMAFYPDATLLAGGTDVGLWVTKQHKKLPVIIYTGNIVELQNINQTEAGLEIGAAVTYSQAFEALAAYDESLEELLRRLGSMQIRNSGTIGGNIANGSPIGDGMPPLIVLGARIVLRSASGAREIALEDYFIEYRKQDRKAGEFLEKIIVPPKLPTLLFKTYKISKRFDQDISAVCAAFAVTVESGKVSDARIAFGGMAGTPKRASATEKFLHGKSWSEDIVKEAMQCLAIDYSPMTDMRASAEYRLTVAQNLLYRCYLETTGDKVRVYNYGS